MLSKPETVAGALKVCCKIDFPNISVILKIIATMGVTSDKRLFVKLVNFEQFYVELFLPIRNILAKLFLQLA